MGLNRWLPVSVTTPSLKAQLTALRYEAFAGTSVNGLPVPTTGRSTRFQRATTASARVMGVVGEKRVVGTLKTFRCRAQDTAASSEPGTSVWGLSGIATVLVTSLERMVAEGSSGVHGIAPMPKNPALVSTAGAVQSMVPPPAATVGIATTLIRGSTTAPPPDWVTVLNGYRKVPLVPKLKRRVGPGVAGMVTTICPFATTAEIDDTAGLATAGWGPGSSPSRPASPPGCRG